jgi:hypothetical protein
MFFHLQSTGSFFIFTPAIELVVLDVDGATVAIVEDFVIGVTALAKNVFNGIRFDFVHRSQNLQQLQQ